MNDRIILLTGREEAAALSEQLLRWNNDLLISCAVTQDDLEAAFQIPADRRRLIAFSTGVIVPSRLLDLCDCGAINFHPGPPDYPGNQIAAFAAYEGAREFGATAHHMATKVDSGPIIATRCEPIPDGGSRTDYALTGYRCLVFLFNDLSEKLSALDEPVAANGEQWSGPVRTLADMAAMRWIDRGIDAGDFRQRLLGFEDGEPGSLCLNLFGHRFRIVPADAD